MVNTRLSQIPKPVPAEIQTTVPSIKNCKTCQGQDKMSALTNNRKNINKTINRHKYELHEIPVSQPQQQQQKLSKKQKSERGHGGPPSDNESDDGTIDGFDF